MDKVVGLDDVRAELVVVKTPDGSGKLELTKYHSRPTSRMRFSGHFSRAGYRYAHPQ